ncbi:MAG: hypothetical protein ACNA8J_10600 [Gammaproteobacteria bacterium]
MAKPNYAFAKRQRDLAKKKKKEDKRLRKAGGPDDSAAEPQAGPSAEGHADSDSQTVTRQQPEDSVS